jgi:hypothetical protein
MSNWVVSGITLPGDLEWVDEIQGNELRAEDQALNGGLIIQRSRRLAGRPMTLQTPDQRVWVQRADVLSLLALADNPATESFIVTHPDSREFTCRFRYRDGLPVDGAPILFRSPPIPGDPYTLVLRLQIV